MSFTDNWYFHEESETLSGLSIGMMKLMVKHTKGKLFRVKPHLDEVTGLDVPLQFYIASQPLTLLVPSTDTFVVEPEELDVPSMGIILGVVYGRTFYYNHEKSRQYYDTRGYYYVALLGEQNVLIPINDYRNENRVVIISDTEEVPVTP